MTAVPDHVIASFITAVGQSLQAAVGVDATVTQGVDEPGDTISVAIDLRGELAGPVTWRFPQVVALELVRRLLAEADPAPSMTTEGANELANILTGSASEALERAGYRFELGTPRHHAGDLPEGVTVYMSSTSGPIAFVLSFAGAGQAL